MVHRDVGRIGSALIDKRVTTIAAFSVSPIAGRSLLVLSSIVLRAADHQVPVERMHCDTLKLKSIQRSPIKICPRAAGITARRSLPHATIVSGEDRGARSIVSERVRIGMKAIVVPRKRQAAIGRLLHSIRAATTCVPPKINLIRIVWINRDWHVVVALSIAEAAAAGKLSRPRRAEIKGIDLLAHCSASPRRASWSRRRRFARSRISGNYCGYFVDCQLRAHSRRRRQHLCKRRRGGECVRRSIDAAVSVINGRPNHRDQKVVGISRFHDDLGSVDISRSGTVGTIVSCDDQFLKRDRTRVRSCVCRTK